MKFLKLYENSLKSHKMLKTLFLVGLLVNVIASLLTKSFLNVIVSLLIAYYMYRENKKLRELEFLIFKTLPHDLEEDGYYKKVSDDYIKSYTYYFDKKEGMWIVEYRISDIEAKIIKLNDFEKFDFFSTEKDYQPVLKLEKYELKNEVKEWFESHPEINITLMPKKITGEIEFENIYQD